MGQWGRRIRGALGMGLIWAVGGLLVGGFIELLDNVVPPARSLTRLVDMWPQTLAIPSFLLGVLFAVVLGIAARRRRFHELSLRQFAGWGAAAGMLLGALGVSKGAPLFFMAITTLWSAGAAAGSLVLARMAEGRRPLAAGVDDAVLGEGESPPRLGGGG